MNGKKNLPTRRIQRLIEHLFPFNPTVQYLLGNKMHIADILACKDLEPSDQLIPISFNVYTRSTRPLKLYDTNKHKVSTNIPYITKTTTPKITPTKPTVVPRKLSHPLMVQPHISKPSSSVKTPPVPIGILQKSIPSKPPPQQKDVRKSLVNLNLKIPQTLPPLDLPPPDTKEAIETYRPPDETIYHKLLPVLMQKS